MPNPEASNSNQAGSDSTLGGRTTGKGGGQNPFEELTKLPEFGKHMAKMQDAHDIVSYKFVDEAGNAIGDFKMTTVDYGSDINPDMTITPDTQEQSPHDFPEPTPVASETQDNIDKYDTYDKITESLESLKEQETWRQTLSDLAGSIKSIHPEGGNNKGWIMEFTGKGSYPPKRGFEYTIKAVTSDRYNQDSGGKLAGPDEKRFTIGIDYGYAQYFDASAPLKEVNGFSRRKESDPFPEETDFTTENKTENRDIPDRINKALYELFGKNHFSYKEEDLMDEWDDEFGYDYKKQQIEYPDADTLMRVSTELDKIISDIGSEESLAEKRKILEEKKLEFEKAKKEAEEKEENNIEQQKLSTITEMLDSGGKLDLDSLRLLFDDKYDNDSSVSELRQKLGIEENVIKQLLNN